MDEFCIHPSFNKKELVEIIKKHEIDIDTNQTRNEICRDLFLYINNFNLHYLFKPNTVKKITVKQREAIALYSKSIISFTKNGCNIKKSDFNTLDDIIHTANYISQFGDIISVRRALKLLKEKCDINIEPIISEETRFKIEKNKELKKLSVGSLQINRGNFKVVFD